MPAEKSPEPEMTYLRMQAEMGITKHIGGLGATKLLISWCGIKEGMHVLDAGCGIGTTSCRLAEKYCCKVTGIDVSPKMVEWANKKAKEKKLEGKVSFRVADAQDLPFKDSTFDAVISESVTVFIKDKKKALREYFRVVKKGGYVGINESTWIKKPLPKEILDYTHEAFDDVEFSSPSEWEKMLKDSGLKETKCKAFTIGYFQEIKDRFELIGIKGLALGGLRMIWSLITKPYFRKYFIKLSKSAAKVPRNIFDYMGYGIYAGKK